jgi:imidazole glycerol-phosphate synthase subunit HisF
MLAKRIIPCLDINNGRTVKGINFLNIRDAGDPVELAMHYSREGADELVFLDITATIEKRKTLVGLVKKVAAHINIPFTVGGGITSVDNAFELLQNGADKISVNSAAFKDPGLINQMAKEFGSQCVVLAIDARKEKDSGWYVYLNGGRINSGMPAYEWAKQAVDLGIGEILLTSMNNDGTKNGFAEDITSLFSLNLPVPVIASGGAGRMKHFADLFANTTADAALAASVFHFGEIRIMELKQFLFKKNINVRL